MATSSTSLTDADEVMILMVSTAISLIITALIVIASVEIKVIPYLRDLNQRVEKLERNR